MTDSKFCEHGVNVGLENPPVFCGQCPPDTITKLRADLASVRLDYANECDRARRAEARHERDKDELRADLARVTKERDEARAGLNERHRAVVAERDALEASLIEARAKVAGLEAAMPSGDEVALIRAVSSDLHADGRGGYRAANVIDAWLTRYAEALGDV